jgi:hypothetical protein
MDPRIAANSTNHGLLRSKPRTNRTTDHLLSALRNVYGHKLNENHEIISLKFKKNNNMNVSALQGAGENPVTTRYVNRDMMPSGLVYIRTGLPISTSGNVDRCRRTCVRPSPLWKPHASYIIYLTVLYPYGITKRDLLGPRRTAST